MPWIVFVAAPICTAAAAMAAVWWWWQDREAVRSAAVRAEARRRAGDPEVAVLADLHLAALVAGVAVRVSGSDAHTSA